ncbi:MAG: molybdate ABC transporter substrate-binding protein [Acidobacteria bacterium]|nr:molybdate ABC transporter substrate-binding protein [Acidobacteriota bacterium]
MPTVRSTILAGACLGLGLFASRAPTAEIRVSAAASLTDALQEASAAWRARGGEPIAFNFGASSLLARQIEEGGPADLFFSADEAKMDGLAAKGAIDRNTRKSLLSNSLVFVVAKERGSSVVAPEDLLKPGIRAIALAETRSVPAGIYAREYLTRKGLWDRVSGRVVPTENIRAALAAVEAGNADVAVVYRTDALISKKVAIAWEVPVPDGPKISYPAAVLTTAKNAAGARGFLAFLQSPAGTAIFRRHGFLIPK